MTEQQSPVGLTPEIVAEYLEYRGQRHMAAYVRDFAGRIQRAEIMHAYSHRAHGEILQRLQQYEQDAGKLPEPIRPRRTGD